VDGGDGNLDILRIPDLLFRSFVLVEQLAVLDFLSKAGRPINPSDSK
jgi:hypothetical protein